MWSQNLKIRKMELIKILIKELIQLKNKLIKIGMALIKI
jgi:hypothetical protein